MPWQDTELQGPVTTSSSGKGRQRSSLGMTDIPGSYPSSMESVYGPPTSPPQSLQGLASSPQWLFHSQTPLREGRGTVVESVDSGQARGFATPWP